MYISINIFVYTCMCVRINMYACVYIYMCICVYVCMYILSLAVAVSRWLTCVLEVEEVCRVAKVERYIGYDILIPLLLIYTTCNSIWIFLFHF